MIKSRTRRRLLIAAGLVGGAFVVGGYFFYRPRDRLRLPEGLASPKGASWLTAWLRIDAGGGVTVAVPRQEMGQGVTTALPMLVAEELDCDPASLRFEQAPVDPVYANATLMADGVPFRPDDHSWLARLARVSQYKVGELLGVQATGGSTSVRDAWEVMRRAGAAARAMLVGAAAARWGVAPGECRTELGTVRFGDRSLRYAELVAEAARQPIPGDPALKNPAQYRVIGSALPRLDVPAKTDGSAQFGIDVRVPGLRYAALAQCPVFGGSLKRADADKAKAMPGVQAVIELEATSTSAAAVAVVADRWWRAKDALKALQIEWHDGPNAKLDSAAQRKLYADLLDGDEARTYESVGNAPLELAAAKQVVQARYEVPYLAHATMEPINCTALVKDGYCDIWVGSQSPTLVKWLAAGPAGVQRDRVRVHTPFLGGGFGRRAEMDVVVQAAAIARQVMWAPVQLIWSREEDIQHDVYRPMAMASFRCALDAQGGIRAWHNRVVGQSCTGDFTARLQPAAASDLMKDKTTAEGAFDLPYAMPHRLVEHVLVHQPVPVGFWRSVGHSYNAFFVEAFLDEVAHAARRDPYEFRRALLAQAPRHLRVLDAAAQKAGWGSSLPPRTGRGIALAESFHSIVAQVAEVEVGADNALRVKRVVCAIDCGRAVNPGIVERQMESGIVFGLSAALYGEITLKGGRVEQSNFPDYDVVRMAACPAIETHIVESGWAHLGGVGEPGTPPVAPAVANAVFAATGQRLRKLPLRLA